MYLGRVMGGQDNGVVGSQLMVWWLSLFSAILTFNGPWLLSTADLINMVTPCGSM